MHDIEVVHIYVIKVVHLKVFTAQTFHYAQLAWGHLTLICTFSSIQLIWDKSHFFAITFLD